MALKVKRVYEAPAEADGMRILVDRLWPRGIAKDKAKVDLWLKAIAPGNDLRRRFHARPEQWDAFVEAYAAELATGEAAEAVGELRRRMRKGTVTLLYAARDQQHNNAVALKALLTRSSRS
jgi:uncharacterized protein YeaO (DUF488 family)